jgi:23S rRNA (guanine745-N1)-methyltransferase
VSAPDSILVKAIPGKSHLLQLRYAVHEQLRNAEYSNQQVINYFQQHLNLVDRRLVNRTITITKSQIQTLLSMTPLMFNVDYGKIDCSDVTSITVESEILVGQFTSSG